MDDAELLGLSPDYVSIGAIFKATPHTEGDARFIYFEASNEGLDQQGEVIVAKALEESKDYYLRYGNVDIDHLTKLGPKLGVPDSQSYEIGIPREVRMNGRSTFVKSEIYRGDTPAAVKANQFWESLKTTPPSRWYPSVGGAALHKSVRIDPVTRDRHVVIEKVRWTNIGMSKTPVNQHVGTCATIPVGAFAKSIIPGADLSFDITKALEAGYGTDSATLTGGGALRKQSLHGVSNYFDFRNRLAKAMRARECGNNPSSRDLVAHAVKTYGMDHDGAAEHVERFMSEIRDGMKDATKRDS